jgi:DNA transposition AAA+ family ATPase
VLDRLRQPSPGPTPASRPHPVAAPGAEHPRHGRPTRGGRGSGSRQFADAVRRESYLGLCPGPAGIGKTLSARRYTHWDTAEPLIAHQYRPLGDDELALVLSRHWPKLGLTLDLTDLTDFTDAHAVAAVSRITRGNVRLVHRLVVQIERIMEINDMTVITGDVVETARSTLVIGDTWRPQAVTAS